MNFINIEKDKNNIVKKSNQLLKAKENLSTTSVKMLTMVISMIKKDDVDFQEYALNIANYKKKIDVTNKEKSFYIKQAEELMSNPFILDGIMFNWCSSVDFQTLNSHIIFTIHPKLKKFLLNLKDNFLQYDIINILNLKSKYSIKLYEILLSEYNKNNFYNNRKIINFEIELNKLIELLNIPQSYKFENIKQRILLKSQNDFEKNKVDIKFSFHQGKKIGKKIYSIIFEIENNNFKSKNKKLFNDLKSFIKYIRTNFINVDILKFIDKYSKEEVLLSVDTKGRLYNKLNTLSIKKERSAELWNELYNLSLEDKLLCLKQKTLF
jgi:plasmid replication initiation protein